MYPPAYQKNYNGCMLSGLGIVWLTLIVAAVGIGYWQGEINKRIALDSASQVSSSLAGEVGAAQRLTNDEAQRTLMIANAEKQNNEGKASVTLAQGQSELANARANKTNAEARTIEDDRNAKKFGYGGLALRDVLDGLGGAPGLLACLGLSPLIILGAGFVFGVSFVLNRKHN